MHNLAKELILKSNYTFDDLIKIMEILRSDEGCPWDKEQTHKSIRRNLIEETYEVIEAIDTDNYELMCEELGDLLLQVVFHSKIAEDEGEFNINNVADGICKKLILRHPHIFADIKADTSEEVLNNWDKIKIIEKSQKSDREVLASVSKSLPALIRADKVLSKAKKLGYDTIGFDKYIAENSDKLTKEEYVGEVLMAAVSLAKSLDVEPEQALEIATDKLVLSVSNEEK